MSAEAVQGQKFDGRRPGARQGRNRQIALVPLGEVDTTVLQYLLLVLPEQTGLFFCHPSPTKIDLSAAYLSDRQQYHSTQLLEKLQALDLPDTSLRLGLTQVDLCVPVLTFVFGEARLGGEAGIVSMHRLHPAFYGLPEDSELLLKRVEKECLHEIGHLAGLTHCERSDCVMSFSNAVESVDLKEPAYCASCRAKFFF